MFVVVATDGGGVAFYATAGVSSKGGVLTPPFAPLRTTHQLVSPVYTPRMTRTPTNLFKTSGVGGGMCDQSHGQFRRYGMRCGCCASSRKRGWMWAAKRHISPAWVVVGKEMGSGRRNDTFRRLLKGPVVTKNEFVCSKIEIVEGVVVSTPSPMHLTGLPHHGSPLVFSYPPTSAPLLRNLAHIPR